jgi:3-methylcrotonyl-CoA carboxylase beta subunit
MEGESAVKALYGSNPGPDLADAIQRTRADYERWLDAKYAAARGHCDALIDPKETREVLALALEVTLHRPRATALALETL